MARNGLTSIGWYRDIGENKMQVGQLLLDSIEAFMYLTCVIKIKFSIKIQDMINYLENDDLC